jgi:hypothetical protein
MKAISLCQPWASLLVHGLKHLDTRPWSTSHRGPLAIHASKRFPVAARMLTYQEPYKTLLAALGYLNWCELPTGALLGVAELVRCRRVPELKAIPELERQLGDFRPEHWAWTFAKARPLSCPVPYRGQLGIFEASDPFLARALEAGHA